MPTFKYTARTPDAKITSGSVEADTSAHVADIINSYGFLPIRISEEKQSILEKDLFESFEFVTPKDVLIFTRQLTTLLGAGLTLINSLVAVLEQVENKSLRKVLQNIKDSVSSGSTFSEALRDHPKHFSQVYTSMVNAGEKGGILVDILKRQAQLIEYEQNVRTKIKKATRYPIMVIVALFIASIVLVIFVLPNFMGLFSLFGGELPLPTRILIASNRLLVNYWHVIIATIILSFFGLKKYIATHEGRYNWDKFLLKIPILGPLLKQLIISRFARVLAQLNQSGLAILESMEIVGKTTDNQVIARALKDVQDKIKGGQGISDPMKESNIFPMTVVNMIAIGERSGHMTEMLFKVADYYDEDVDRTLDNLSSMIEPILIGVLSFAVLLMALAVFLPMWNMISLMK